MLLILLTNMNEARRAFFVVWACNVPMIVCNAIAVTICSIVLSIMYGECGEWHAQVPKIATQVRTGMLVVAIMGIFASYAISRTLLNDLFRSDLGMALTQESELVRNFVLLMSGYLQIVLLGTLFIVNYVLIRFVVVRNMWRVDEELERITSGDLSVEVDVRDSVEFASLSDGINATVGSLREAIAAEGARIEADLATARAIQESTLPRTFPPFPHIDAFDIYASMDAAREVGGDFYDFFLMDNHTLGFFIADASGKGIPAALLMMEAKSELDNCMKSGAELSEAVGMANRSICQGNDEDMFVTAWVATLDFRTGELTCVNAGHNYPLLRRDGTWCWLKGVSGLFLGGLDSVDYAQETFVMEPGDQLLLYTDGVTEAFDAHGAPYGSERLEEFLNAHADKNPRELIHALRADIQAWAGGAEQSDDVTMLCLEYAGTTASGGEGSGKRDYVVTHVERLREWGAGTLGTPHNSRYWYHPSVMSTPSHHISSEERESSETESDTHEL